MKQSGFSPWLSVSAVAAALVFSGAGVLEAQQTPTVASVPNAQAQQQEQAQAQQGQAQQGQAQQPPSTQSQSTTQSQPTKVQIQPQSPQTQGQQTPQAQGQQPSQPQAQPQQSQKAPAQTSHQDLDKAPPPAVQGTPTNGAPQPGPNGVMPGVKAGSQADVNAVGTRDIGGRGLGNWYSTETEIKEGKAYSMELEKSVKFITDPVVTEYVNRIGQNIVKNSDAKVPFTIKVIDSDEINAMALPGGFFYVNSGLILAADDEAEMAGVMAHEISHVAAHHAMREQTRMNYAQFSTIPLIMVGGGLGYGLYEAASIGLPMTFLQFSRDFEKQADFLGVQYMYRAGYDPQAFVSFFEKVQNLEKTKPGMVAKAFDSHPQTPDRIENTQKEIARLLPPRQEYLVTTSEFDDVKTRLARIENKRKLRDGSNPKKPTLRRASAGGTQDNGTNTGSGTQSSTTANNGQTTTTGDDPPTLHRRDN
jgi:hypothetical protein